MVHSHFRLRGDLITTELDGEVLVYNPATGRAHNLRGLARDVFERLSDPGSLDPHRKSEVLAVLDEFRRLELLQVAPCLDPGRRKLLKTAALGGLVLSVGLPTPAAAASCLDCGGDFSTCGTGNCEPCFNPGTCGDCMSYRLYIASGGSCLDDSSSQTYCIGNTGNSANVNPNCAVARSNASTSATVRRCGSAPTLFLSGSSIYFCCAC